MKILAIDPGTTESAYVIWDGREILAKGKTPNRSMKSIVIDAAIGGNYRLVIEMIACYGMAVGAEVFETCLWIGRYIERWEEIRGSPPELITRIQVKSHICHSAKANDSNIRQALEDRIGKKGTKRSPGPTFGMAGDMWAALAVAVTAHDRMTGKV